MSIHLSSQRFSQGCERAVHTHCKQKERRKGYPKAATTSSFLSQTFHVQATVRDPRRVSEARRASLLRLFRLLAPDFAQPALLPVSALPFEILVLLVLLVRVGAVLLEPPTKGQQRNEPNEPARVPSVEVALAFAGGDDGEDGTVVDDADIFFAEDAVGGPDQEVGREPFEEFADPAGEVENVAVAVDHLHSPKVASGTSGAL